MKISTRLFIALTVCSTASFFAAALLKSEGLMILALVCLSALWAVLEVASRDL